MNADGDFLYEGAYTVNNSGGADIGKFTASASIPGLPTLSSPRPFSGAPTITRSNGMTVTWNPNNQGGVILVQVTAAIEDGYSTGSAGTLTIPRL